MGWQVPKLGYPEGLGVFPGSSLFAMPERGHQDSTRRVDMVFMSPDVKLNALERGKPPCKQDNVRVYDERCFRFSNAGGRDQGWRT